MLRKRGKKGIFVAIAFATLALTSVGFSTWIAAYQSVVETELVTVQVADVLGANTIQAAVIDGDFCFDAQKDDTTGPIIYSGTSNGEDLQLQFSITVAKDTVFNGIKLLATSEDATFTSYFNSKSSGENPYFNSPFKMGTELNLITGDGTTNSGFTITKSENGNNNIYTVTVDFTWGSFFGGKNPCLVTDNSLVSSYITALKDLKQNVDEKSFKFTLTHPETKITSI